jgi:hypothetical protein
MAPNAYRRLVACIVLMTTFGFHPRLKSELTNISLSHYTASTPSDSQMFIAKAHTTIREARLLFNAARCT